MANNNGFLKIKNERNPTEISDPAIEFPYKLDTFQHNSAVAIEDGDKNILVVAHTSAGKSTVAEYAIAKSIKNNKKIIYTSPIKTLSNQKYRDFKDKFGDNVGILTGDIKLKPEAQCVIMTTEILRNLLYINKDFLEDVQFVVYDEIHYFNDPDRGHVWEESIIMLPREINLIMLSASISSPEEFANWIGNIKKKEILLFSTSFRPVPLLHHVYDAYTDEILPIMNNNKEFRFENYDKTLANYKKQAKNRKSFKSVFSPFIENLSLKSLLPAIFFTFSRDKCTQYAKLIHTNLITYEERAEIEKIYNLNTHRLLDNPDEVIQVQELKNMLYKGVCVHHSGLIPVLKEIVEELFSKGLIKILFATETFAVGVNMPTRTVVFTGLEKFSGVENDFRYLRSDEYTQMSGRAGRRGKDTVGTVIYLPLSDIIERHNIYSVLTGKQPKMISKFLINTKFILKALKSTCHDISGVLDLSLLNIENNKKALDCNRDIDNINTSINIAKETLLSYGMDTFELLEKFYNLNDKLTNSKNKERKKIQKELNLLSTQKPKNFDALMNKYIEYIKNEHSLNVLKLDYNNLSNVFDYEIDCAIKFLCELDFIRNDILSNNILDYNELKKDALTYKGVIASEINECNELLMTMIINKKMFDDLEPIEILPILALFIEDKKNDDNVFNKDNLPYKSVEVIENIKIMNRELESLLEKYNIYYNTELNLEFPEIAYKWGYGEKLQFIVNTFGIYEGNFIRNMQKINNICVEIINICEISNNHQLIPKMQEIENLIIRDVVTFISLYIK